IGKLYIHIYKYITGVSFVGLEGNEKEKVVVIGDGIDVVKLTTILRKKVGTTEIISLAEQK
ncbi:disease resistance protein Pik-1-like, partial [Gossypium hirsutum]|uniref:Disease resistance protein Pik-1-like n=1 Tax=Gossypium hirsutum TaxID=3635 RepID=A0ABM2YMJ9_GOSHI